MPGVPCTGLGKDCVYCAPFIERYHQLHEATKSFTPPGMWERERELIDAGRLQIREDGTHVLIKSLPKADS